MQNMSDHMIETGKKSWSGKNFLEFYVEEISKFILRPGKGLIVFM